MLLLPPSSIDAARDRRVGDRRAAARRKTAAEDSIAPETVAPIRQTRPRNGGRRKTDRDQVPPASAPPGSSAAKPHAPLIAQLIAGAMGLEQTRVRRRGSLDDAVKLYERKPERSKPPRGEA